MYIKKVRITPPIPDVLILGAGPAALFLAAACQESGLEVQGIAPDFNALWAPRYGAWRDELGAIPAGILDNISAHTWAGATVFALERHDLIRPYIALSTPRLQSWLTARCNGIRWTKGSAASIAHSPLVSTVTLRSGATLSGRIIVDATGGGSLLERGEAPSAWQTAYGLEITVPGGHPWPLDRIELMDFRGPGPTPSFLYAQPLDAERVFVEETALIGSPGLSIPQLQQRLLARLQSMGITPEHTDHEERCRIRMLGPAPVLGQRTVGFGSAAGMVHPATGYQLARLPAAAEAMAQALVDGLSVGPSEASAAAWSALWPAPRLRQWALYRFGAQILRDLNAEDTRRFFDAFFRIDPALWSGFLSATLPPARLAAAMAAVFSAASLPTRFHLIAAGASGSGLDLLLNLSRPSL
ncbi:MAG: lycopene beta-cyclase [Myxococcota bacterium]|jgi:lycopene beta-cyclase